VLAAVPDLVIWAGSAGGVVAAGAALVGVRLMLVSNRAAKTKVHIDFTRAERTAEGALRVLGEVHFIPFGQSFRIMEWNLRFRAGRKEIGFVIPMGSIYGPQVLHEVYDSGRVIGFMVDLNEDHGVVKARLHIECADGGKATKRKRLVFPDA
jgi:hypothetical protein